MLSHKEANYILHLISLLNNPVIITELVRDDRCNSMVTENSTEFKKNIKMAIVSYLNELVQDKDMTATEAMIWKNTSERFVCWSVKPFCSDER